MLACRLAQDGGTWQPDARLPLRAGGGVPPLAPGHDDAPPPGPPSKSPNRTP